MKRYSKIGFFLLSSLLLAVCLAMAVTASPSSMESLIWEGNVYSSGVPVNSTLLDAGTTYRIVASQVWLYDNSDYLAADAQYYTTSSVDTWDWLNYAQAPGGGSFLQINGQNVTWGPFSNGDTNHTYSIYYIGQGAPLTLQIVDLVDHNYTNNYCHIEVSIYAELTVGGRIVDSAPPSTISLWTVGALLAVSLAAAPIIIYARKAR